MEREYEHDLITRVFPVASDGRISLAYCTEEALAAASVDGFAVVLSTDLFRPDYVEYSPGVNQYGVLEGSFRFGNISLSKKAALAELQAAANGMLAPAMTAIKERQEREYRRGGLSFSHIRAADTAPDSRYRRPRAHTIHASFD